MGSTHYKGLGARAEVIEAGAEAQGSTVNMDALPHWVVPTVACLVRTLVNVKAAL